MEACKSDTRPHQDNCNQKMQHCEEILVTSPFNWKKMNRKAYTKTPVTMAAIKVPKIANVTIAPKFEKNGFWN